MFVNISSIVGKHKSVATRRKKDRVVKMRSNINKDAYAQPPAADILMVIADYCERLREMA